jgi:hypothetical protein
MFECTCVECGEMFSAVTMFAEICSPRCRQRRYRRTEKGKANVLKFNKKVKRRRVKRVCGICGIDFKTTRKSRLYCDECTGNGRARSASQKRHRLKHPVEVHSSK